MLICGPNQKELGLIPSALQIVFIDKQGERKASPVGLAFRLYKESSQNPFFLL